MQQDGISFRFGESVSMAEIDGTLRLAVIAVEAIHGVDCVRVEGRYELDTHARSVGIDLSSEVGRTLALVFGGYARREFGDQAVQIVRTTETGRPQAAVIG